MLEYDVINETSLLLSQPQYQIDIKDDLSFLYLYCIHKIEKNHCKNYKSISSWKNSDEIIKHFLNMPYLSLSQECFTELNQALDQWLKLRQKQLDQIFSIFNI